MYSTNNKTQHLSSPAASWGAASHSEVALLVFVFWDMGKTPVCRSCVSSYVIVFQLQTSLVQTGRVCVTPLKHNFVSVLGSVCVEPRRDSVPWRGYNKVAKTEWLRTIEMYHLPAPEARSLRSKRPQGHASSEGPSGGSSLRLPDVGAPGALGVWPSHPRLCLHAHTASSPVALPHALCFFLSLCILSFSYKDTSHWIWGPPSATINLTLPHYIFEELISKLRFHSQVLGGCDSEGTLLNALQKGQIRQNN